MLSFRKLFARSGKSQSRDTQSASQMPQAGFAAPTRQPLARRRTPYPRRRRFGSNSSAQTSIPSSSGRAGYSPSDTAATSSEGEDVYESHHTMPRLLFDPEVERCLAAFEFRTDSHWARLQEEEDAILARVDPTLMRDVDLLTRRFEEALASDPDDSDEAVRVRARGSRRSALRRRLGI